MPDEADSRKRDLRSLLEGYSAKPSTAIQQKKDAQLTQYEPGSGDGLREIRQALAADPNNEKLQDWLAFSLYCNNEVDEAIQVYGRLSQKHPTNITYHYYLGNCFAKKGLINKALEEWKVVVKLEPYGKMGRKAQARVDQALAYLRRILPQGPQGPQNPGGPGQGGPPRGP